MIKLLIGGSPCTKWSIAQKNNRETKPEGIGWELFENYLIAKERFQPDFFLYENNKSASQAIKDQIAIELGVGTDPKARFTYINSALVSAQNRQRFYVTNFGDIEQPEDRGMLLNDILDADFYKREWHNMPRAIPKRNYVQFDVSGKGYNSEQDRAFYYDGKFGCLPSAKASTKVKVCIRGERKYFNLTFDEVKALQTMPKEPLNK